VVVRVAARVVAMQMEEGTEDSDEFTRIAALDGLDFASSAGGLREGRVSVVLGGARIDLRAATLDPTGARLVIDNSLGGVQVLVRPEWRVEVDEELRGGGGIDVDVTTPDDLPDDAPKLEIVATTRAAGTQILAQGA
jgi:hypothetical protein